MRLFAAVLLLLATMVVPAAAGNASLSRGADKLYLSCNDSGCFAQIKKAGKMGAKKKLGPGGRSNFLKHKKAFAGQGWS